MIEQFIKLALFILALSIALVILWRSVKKKGSQNSMTQPNSGPRLYSQIQIVFASAAGSLLVGSYMLAVNFKRAGNTFAAVLLVFISIGAHIMAGMLLSNLSSEWIYGPISVMYIIGSGVFASVFFESVQKKKYLELKSLGYRDYQTWRMFVNIFLFVLMVIIFLEVFGIEF